MRGRVPAAMRRARLLASARPHLPARLRSRRSRVVVFLGLLGPGLIAANAGNDAGGIATYSEVGAKYGYTLLWAMLLITVSLALVQRSAARMGTVTGKGLAELIRERYGIRWSAFATLCVLVANFGICISDFVGVGAALGLARRNTGSASGSARRAARASTAAYPVRRIASRSIASGWSTVTPPPHRR